MTATKTSPTAHAVRTKALKLGDRLEAVQKAWDVAMQLATELASESRMDVFPRLHIPIQNEAEGIVEDMEDELNIGSQLDTLREYADDLGAMMDVALRRREAA